jgi:hypothetical protein
MLRSSLVAASAVLLCTVASAQQQIQAKKTLGPVRDAGVYHMATKTWTRGGGQSNISPDYIYRNDASSGYFGVGWENCLGTDEIQLPGPTNPAGGPRDSYTLDGYTFGYCKLGAGTIDWTFLWFDSYVPCDDVCSPVNCICQIPVQHDILGLPGGSACWLVTIDLAGGYEICMSADGAPCAPGFQGDGTLDYGACSHCWSTADGATAGPILNGDPTWVPNGDGTCYQPGFGNACGLLTGTGLGAQDLFGVCDGGKPIPCALSPGCYWFGGYINNNGCGLPSNVPFASFNLCLFADCNLPNCEKGGPPCVETVYCDETQDPSNVMDIAISDCNLSGPDIHVTGSAGPANQFIYLLASAGGSGVVNDPPGTKGDLCLAGMGAIARYVKDIQSTGAGGTADTNIANSMTAGAGYAVPTPPGGNIDAGETWNFQYWHRQPMGQPSTFSQALSVTFTN